MLHEARVEVLLDRAGVAVDEEAGDGLLDDVLVLLLLEGFKA